MLNPGYGLLSKSKLDYNIIVFTIIVSFMFEVYVIEILYEPFGSTNNPFEPKFLYIPSLLNINYSSSSTVFKTASLSFKLYVSYTREVELSYEKSYEHNSYFSITIHLHYCYLSLNNDPLYINSLSLFTLSKKQSNFSVSKIVLIPIEIY